MKKEATTKVQESGTVNTVAKRVLDVIQRANPDDISIQEEGNHIRIDIELADTCPEKGKWAQVAEYMANQNLLEGQSEEFCRDVRKFRKEFSLDG